MKRFLLWAGFVVYVSAIALAVVWVWQANYAKRHRMFRVPQWIAGCNHVRYYVIVHRSQIKRYGTVWKVTSGRDWLDVCPLCSEKEIEGYLAYYERMLVR
jgi:hypothetical protein